MKFFLALVIEIASNITRGLVDLLVPVCVVEWWEDRVYEAARRVEDWDEGSKSEDPQDYLVRPLDKLQ